MAVWLQPKLLEVASVNGCLSCHLSRSQELRRTRMIRPTIKKKMSSVSPSSKWLTNYPFKRVHRLQQWSAVNWKWIMQCFGCALIRACILKSHCCRRVIGADPPPPGWCHVCSAKHLQVSPTSFCWWKWGAPWLSGRVMRFYFKVSGILCFTLRMSIRSVTTRGLGFWLKHPPPHKTESVRWWLWHSPRASGQWWSRIWVAPPSLCLQA